MVWSLQGKNVLITGGTDGIGRAVARQLIRKGAKVTILARDVSKVRGRVIECDLSSFASIRQAVEVYTQQCGRLDVLIHSAGVMPVERQISTDGIELNRAVNYFAPVLLTELLLPLIQKSREARIINVTSSLYKRGIADLENLRGEGEYNRYQAYGESKLLFMLYTRALARRLMGTGITVNAVHPGWVRTKLAIGALKESSFFGRIYALLKMRPARWGARTIVYLAANEQVGAVTGEYFISKKIAATKPIVRDAVLADRLVAKTKEILAPYLI